MFRIINIGTLSQNKFWGERERLHSDISATCTLLEVGGHRLLVDPSPRPDPLARLLFDRAGLRPEAIDRVFVTHWHADHRYGLDLFEHATWLMAADGINEWRERAPREADIAGRFLPAEGALPEGVSLFHAPGHTPALYALRVVSPWGPLFVAGDAVMTREYFEAEEGFLNSVDFEQAADTIRRIKAEAALVIPGHDNLVLNLKREDG
jgi:glyoxylase-like metal-dependent hydrolase (beta-lactamase superfamily II)